MAVQLEPITFSGERITIAVAIVPGDGSTPRVISTLAPEPVQQVFGQLGKHMLKLVGSVIGELQAFLATGGQLQAWQPALQGVYSGPIIPTRNTSMDAIIRSALTHSSIFSAKGNDTTSRETADRSLSSFQQHIKDIVLAAREGMKIRFNQKMSLYGGKAQAHISYVGTHLAINLASLDTTMTSHSQQRDAAHRKINQLLALRETPISHRCEHLMAGLWLPKRELTPAQEELCDSYATELEFSANRAGVQFVLANGNTSMSEAAMPFARKIIEDA